jgi:Mrp family chromosome partitioning ATPase
MNTHGNQENQMSKNFELLRQTDWSQEFFQGLPTETRHIETAQKCIKRRPMGNDQISTLVQRVFLDPRSSHIRCVMFTANSRRVGCTWVCAHAAKMLAESIEGTVCAVDTNFREPALHSYFSVEGRDGLANAVAESRPAKEFAKQTQEANLWLVAAGRSTGRSGSTASGALLETHLRELRRGFDYLLVDAALVSTRSTATEAARVADGAVLVLRSTELGPKAVLDARRHLDKAHVPLLGVVLNQRSSVPSVLDRLMR